MVWLTSKVVLQGWFPLYWYSSHWDGWLLCKSHVGRRVSEGWGFASSDHRSTLEKAACLLSANSTLPAGPELIVAHGSVWLPESHCGNDTVYTLGSVLGLLRGHFVNSSLSGMYCRTTLSAYADRKRWWGTLRLWETGSGETTHWSEKLKGDIVKFLWSGAACAWLHAQLRHRPYVCDLTVKICCNKAEAVHRWLSSIL